MIILSNVDSCFIFLSSLIHLFIDVEDGHTLHMVVQQPVTLSPEQSDDPGLVKRKTTFMHLSLM